jgi:hypothetical protein
MSIQPSLSGYQWCMTDAAPTPEVHRTTDHPNGSKDTAITPTTQANGELTEDEAEDGDTETDS